MSISRISLGLLSLPLVIGCVPLGEAGGGPVPQARLPMAAFCVQDDNAAVPIQAEVARTWSEKRIGLMGRRQLGAGQGMLFIYDEERSAEQGFWMKGTLIPLDIAYLGRTGNIVAVQEMQPCHEEQGHCPTYSPGVPYWAALEANAGFFAQHGVSTGGSVLKMPADECRRNTDPT